MIKEDHKNDMDAFFVSWATTKRKKREFHEGNGIENVIHSKSMDAEVDFEGQADAFL